MSDGRGWRLRIRHRSGFGYESEVVSSYNEARLMPLSTLEQLVIDADVEIEPAVPTYRYWDYWGTLVHAFDVHVPHVELVVTASSLVETEPFRDVLETAGWDVLRSAGVADEFSELLEPTGYTPEDAELQEVAVGLAGGLSPRETCEAVGEWVRGRLRYEQGTTTVSSTALDAVQQGSGVCQDFAHVTLTMLRSVGIPSRYVSGYLHPFAEAEVGTTVSGQSHAWVEAWLGEWVAFDPTNGRPVGERHVVVGRARDYADVSPLRGIYSGGTASSLAVDVELTRLA